MSIVAWILFGLVAGYVGSRLVNSTGPRMFFDTVLGIAGAVAGGAVFKLTDGGSAPGFKLSSVFAAVCGAAILLFVYHAAAGSSVSPRPKVRLP
jgi:uncharacterized membrane protein YeaQ/YmgE (transglycosylase-associated protein family)